jgi:tRNA pseudouridine38-40 synthase
MQIAADFLLGTHDFSAFRSSSCEAKTATRTIYKLEVSQNFSIKNNNYMSEPSFKPCEITIDVLGSGFLKYMVRNIVGTLIEVGRGKLLPEEIEEILLSRDRKKAGPTAQPQGLFLMEVFY